MIYEAISVLIAVLKTYHVDIINKNYSVMNKLTTPTTKCSMCLVRTS